ncbi:hypothetical protein FRC02_005518 [Tulasnella sp. 418]|nr:hypothetical protein FRC02_005518 [Tulasnella sp. 418]
METADDIIRLLKHGLSLSEKGTSSGILSAPSPGSSRTSPDTRTMCSCTISSSPKIVFRNPSTSYLAEFRSDSVDYLHHRMLHRFLFVSDYFSETWNFQVIFVLEHLVMFHRSGGSWKTAFFAMFLHCITTVKASLQWPSYLPSDKLQIIIDLASREFKHDQIDFSNFFGDGGLTKAWPGDSVLLFWRSAIKLKPEGIIAGGWKDSAFFMPDVVNLVLDHYHHVTEQGS